jgi:hypothetical protein
MTQTVEEIEAQYRLDYPYPQQTNVGGVQRDMTQVEYEQFVADGVANIHQQQLADEAAEAEAEIRRQAKAAYTKLEQNYEALSGGGTLTGPQQRAMLADVTRVVYHMIRILADRGIIGRD